MQRISSLQKARLSYQPKLPPIFNDLSSIELQAIGKPKSIDSKIAVYFPATQHLQKMVLKKGKTHTHDPLKVGVVFSGGQAAGGHNVITGLYDALKKLNKGSTLFGFLDGPSGILENRSIELTAEILDNYRNQGGFDLLGSGRTKIETPEQFVKADQTVKSLNLDALVIIGGDDSNTNAALLAEYFLKQGTKTQVIGVPKTIDGDLRTEDIEVSFGFDTAVKTYSESIGNLLRDALSAKKYYFFVKVMGRSASHIALQCALETQPNLTLIGEEVQQLKKSLNQLVGEITDLIVKRAALGKNYGLILIPEGIIEFIPEIGTLVEELNTLLAKEAKIDEVKIVDALSKGSKECFDLLPKEIQKQLLLERDAHGNVQVSKIETERLFLEMVKEELKRRAKKGEYQGKFSPQPIFLGYEGRSCFPTNFDAEYCYALGFTAAVLIDSKLTGYICAVRHLDQSVDKWEPMGVPLASMINLEKRHGKMKPVIEKALVDLNGNAFKRFARIREKLEMDDLYLYPGPVQY